MKKARFSESQSVEILKEGEAGMADAEYAVKRKKTRREVFSGEMERGCPGRRWWR